MSAPARLVLGLAPPDEEAIEEALYASRELHVLASAADAAELAELTASREPALVLVSPGLPGLDPASLARLRALGPRLAGLALDEEAARRLEPLDLDVVLRAPFDPGRLLALLDGSRMLPERARASEPPPRRPERPAREGSVVAVIGAKGAPGASELAASFAALVSREHRVLLAEFDGDGGRLEYRLGVDPRAGSLLGLVRALAAGETDPQALLPHWLVTGVRGWPTVLPGLPDPELELAELQLPGLPARLLALLCASFPLVVCDLGQRLRHGGTNDLAVRLHREIVLAADALVLVLGARAEQLAAGLAQLDLLLDELALAPEAIRVVVNGQPGLRAPHDADADGVLSHELATRGLGADAWLPYDERALRAAIRRGLPLASAARRGPYARALDALVRGLLLPSSPRPTARKRRLAPLPAVTEGDASGEEVALPWRA